MNSPPRIIIGLLSLLFFAYFIYTGFVDPIKTLLDPETREFFHVVDLEEDGMALSPAEAEALESHLAQHADDIDARYKLLAYYESHHYEEASQNARQQHGLWLIENAPDSQHMGWTFLIGVFDRQEHTEEEAHARQVWLDHLDRDPSNEKLLANAARYFSWYDAEIAKDLLSKLCELQPNDSQWAENLARLHYEDIFDEESNVNVDAAKEALVRYETARELMKNEHEEMPGGPPAKAMYSFLERVLPFDEYKAEDRLLPQVALCAFESGDHDRAAKYAQDLLDTDSEDFFFEHDHHNGTTILGLIALASGEIDAAKKHLIDSLPPGEPKKPNMLFPNVLLASRLYDFGESDTVIEYFELFSRKYRGLGLKDWIEELKAGNKPDMHPSMSMMY